MNGDLARQKREFLLGVALTAPLAVLALGHGADWWGDWADGPLLGWLMFLPATPVQFVVGRSYYTGGLRSLRAGGSNMDVLVALGSSVAYFQSLVVLLLPGVEGPLHFTTAAMIITLIRLGKWLEARAKRRTTGAIRGLLDLSPETARLLRDGVEKEVPAASVHPGDTVVVRPGERIPVDGLIVSGHAAVDTSSFTGEPLPADCGPGDSVLGGSINRDGSLTVRATAVGADSVLARITRLVERAQEDKAPVQRLANRVAAIFVPIIIVVALIAFAAWLLAGAGFQHAMMRLVAVLVIACPCALGLATPTAVMVGTGLGARHGILFRNPEMLERARAINVLLVDKTVMAVEVDGTCAGQVAVSDTIRDGAAATVAGLESRGVDVVMLTGDSHEVADAVARAVGVPQVVASVAPDERAAVVAGFHADCAVVGMVGDGVNDAPALAAADVGIAMGLGSDVAIQAADVTLVRGELGDVPRAMALSRRTMTTIRQNLFWAFCYNLLLVPAAAGAFHGAGWLPGLLRDVHPVLAAAAMATSSVTVVLNSLRLEKAGLD